MARAEKYQKKNSIVMFPRIKKMIAVVAESAEVAQDWIDSIKVVSSSMPENDEEQDEIYN